MNNTIQGFELWLLGKGISPDTIKRVLLTIKRVQKRYTELTLETAQTYITDLYKQGAKPNYINRELANLKHWFNFTGEELNIPYAKKRETVKGILTEKEITDFINLPREHKAPRSTHETYTLLWTILAQTGMRPKEVATLKQENLRDDGVYLYETKTHKPRFVPLLPETNKRLYEFAKDKDYIFTTKTGKLVSRGDWSREFRHRLKRLNITRPYVSAYSLRHSKIYRMMSDDISPYKIRKLVGHANLQSTLEYDHITTKDVTEANLRDSLFREDLSNGDKSDMLIEKLQALLTKRDNFEVKKNGEGVEIKIIWG